MTSKKSLEVEVNQAILARSFRQSDKVTFLNFLDTQNKTNIQSHILRQHAA